MATDEEIEAELEAMEAVYGSDCIILRRLPPELQIMLTPYTAEDTSVQFVQAVVVVKAGEQYPTLPPELELRDAKGLDEKRHAELLSHLRTQAAELSSGPLLLTLCEAAKDLLTSMNFPDGDCCFCRFPLMMECVSGPRPFFKLKSCFHCFHSDCFGSWWEWLHDQKQIGDQTRENVQIREDVGNASLHGAPENAIRVLCPVCRTILLVDDVNHVVNSLADHPRAEEEEATTGVLPLVTSMEELTRKALFASQFEAQKARGGIIELKKLDVIQPGMVLAAPVPSISLVENGRSGEASCDGSRQQLSIAEVASSDSSPGHLDLRATNVVGQRKSKQPMQGRKEWQKRPLNKQPVGNGLRRGVESTTRSDAPYPASRRLG